jgi:hypothetical protein
MKKIHLTLVLLFAMAFADAQIVSIPDINFKLKLIEQGVDSNSDGLIQQSEASAISSLDLSNTCINNFTGLISFNNLINFKYENTFSCSSSGTPTINLSNLINLQGIRF